MTSLNLLLLRHAKSDWDTVGASDEQRSLSQRGREDALAMGKYMKSNHLIPERILCSTATRARETLQLVNQEFGIDENRINYLPDLYLASLSTLLTILSRQDSTVQTVMLVAHNPGLDELVTYLSPTRPPLTNNGKLMTTCCLANLIISDRQKITEGCAELISITRPVDL